MEILKLLRRQTMLTNKDYCDYDTCVALNELGLSFEDTSQRFERNILICRYEEVPRPSLYEAQKWLREERGVIVEVFVDDDSDTPITYNIYKDSKCIVHHHGNYYSVKDWNVTLLEGIKEAIKLLKEEK